MLIPSSNTIWCNGRPVVIDDIVSNHAHGHDSFEISLFNFTRRWLSDIQDFQITTSGSTGTPGVINISRQKMIASARRTIDAFELRHGQTALLCLNPDFIAGQMMIVRSLMAGLSLIAVTPSSDPMSHISQPIDFAAMIPMQVHDLIHNNKEAFNQLGTVIIGGGAIDPADIDLMHDLPSRLYATYGMTETVSHVALRQLNGNSASVPYKALPGVHFAIDERGCLVIIMDDEQVSTNDLAELVSETEFNWLGRWDNIINSGGLKILPEKLEGAISAVLVSAGLPFRFFVSGVPDPRLGNKVVLVVEALPAALNCHQLRSLFKSTLQSHEQPRDILACPRFKETPTGKVDRINTLGLAISVCGSSY